jgi:carbon starvation protein
MPLLIVVLACLAIAYRFYSAFLAAKVAVLDDSRITPAHRFNDGQNYHPTHKWVLFGHHFAAISGAGPLIGPVLAIQFGYMPGLIWILVGVCLAGAVQDMLVLAASVRHNGRSLAEIARAEIGSLAGGTASVAILFIVIVALAGLGVVVVKALGGEEIKLAAGTRFEIPADTDVELSSNTTHDFATLPKGTKITYADGSPLTRGESFTIARPRTDNVPSGGDSPLRPSADKSITLPEGVTQAVPGSSWGTFTIACTVPIA